MTLEDYLRRRIEKTHRGTTSGLVEDTGEATGLAFINNEGDVIFKLWGIEGLNGLEMHQTGHFMVKGNRTVMLEPIEEGCLERARTELES